MSVEENKATLYLMYEEVWNKGNMALVAQVASPEYHYGNYRGAEGWGQVVAAVRVAFPDFHCTIDQVVGEGEWLAYRVSHQGTLKGKMGNIEPTGKEAKWKQAYFSQFKDSKLVTTVTFWDRLAFYQQLGVRPPSQ